MPTGSKEALPQYTSGALFRSQNRGEELDQALSFKVLAEHGGTQLWSADSHSDVVLLPDLSGFKLLILQRKQVTKIREPEGAKKNKKRTEGKRER